MLYVIVIAKPFVSVKSPVSGDTVFPVQTAVCMDGRLYDRLDGRLDGRPDGLRLRLTITIDLFPLVRWYDWLFHTYDVR